MSITNDTYIPAEYNTGIVRGDFFEESFVFSVDDSPLNLTGCDARIQIKDLSWARPAVSSLAEFTVTDDPSANSGIFINENTLTWVIGDNDTKLFNPGTYVYDIEITIGNKVRTYVKGQFQVERDVTI